MAYSEEDFLPLSALQHLVYCERRCALIHLEGAWEENKFTAEGRHLHEKAHRSETESRAKIRIARSLPVSSVNLGLSGKCDVVEFHRVNTYEGNDGPNDLAGTVLDGVPWRWTPFPVEYKRGRAKDHYAYFIQLCAQAICLEEMFQVAVSEGALFYNQTKKRFSVEFSSELRDETTQTALRLHALIESRRTPAAIYSEKCERCSLMPVCMPKIGRQQGRVKRYIARISTAAEDAEEELR